MVERLKGPEGISASALAKEVGVSQPTLSRWCSEARTLASENSSKNNSRDAGESPQQWSAQEKLQLVVDAAQLSEAELGSFLRSRGVHKALRRELKGRAGTSSCSGSAEQGHDQEGLWLADCSNSTAMQAPQSRAKGPCCNPWPQPASPSSWPLGRGAA